MASAEKKGEMESTSRSEGYGNNRASMEQTYVREPDDQCNFFRFDDMKHQGFPGFVSASAYSHGSLMHSQSYEQPSANTPIQSAPPLNHTPNTIPPIQRAHPQDESTQSSSACNSPAPPRPVPARSPTPCTHQMAAGDAAYCTG